MIEPPNYEDALSSSVSDVQFLVETGSANRVPAVNGLLMFRGSPRPCSTIEVSQRDLRGGDRYVDVVTGLACLSLYQAQAITSVPVVAPGVRQPASMTTGRAR